MRPMPMSRLAPVPGRLAPGRGGLSWLRVGAFALRPTRVSARTPPPVLDAAYADVAARTGGWPARAWEGRAGVGGAARRRRRGVRGAPWGAPGGRRSQAHWRPSPLRWSRFAAGMTGAHRTAAAIRPRKTEIRAGRVWRGARFL